MKMNIPNYNELPKQSRSEKSIRKNYPEFYEMVITTYSGQSFSEKWYKYRNNIIDAPVCKTCGSPVKFDEFSKLYRPYCSTKCCNSNKEKIFKQQETTLKNYGVLNPSQSDKIKSKKQETTLKNYGVLNPSQSDKIKSKAFNTKLERYGDGNYNNRRQAKNTWKSIYGVDHPSKSGVIMEKKHQTNLEHWNVDWACQLPQAKQYNGSNSGPNIKFKQLLEENNIQFEREFPLCEYSYDFKVGDILVEINPSGTHNMNKGIFGNPGIGRNYHYDKTNTARKNGYSCINVWDWDDLDKVVNMFKSKTILYARKCVIKMVDKKECDEFLQTYHMQNSCNNQSIRYGLYYNDELVEIMTFGKPRYNKNYEYELLRLCTKSNYIIVGGSKKLFKRFINECDPKSIISYCDMSKFGGDVYMELGFSVLNIGKPSIHWYKNSNHITDNLLRQRGFDQLFRTNYGVGYSNEELMNEHNFLKVPDCGQNTYVYTKKEE